MKRITTVLVFLLACLAAVAQEVTLTVDAPESAVAGERFRIIYTINSRRTIHPAEVRSFILSAGSSAVNQP